MRYTVEISDRAAADLRGIYEHIAFTLLSPQNAAGQLDRLEAGIARLDHTPERFRRYDKEPWHSRGLRMLPVDHYIVFYLPNPETSVVTVIRVLYGGRDFSAQLTSDTYES